MNNLAANRIDFSVFFTATNTNPNGDIDEGNAPRRNAEGYGVVSAECIKHKLRMRAQDEGENILYQSPKHKNPDGLSSVEDRVRALFGDKLKDLSSKEQVDMLNEHFWDCRMFGATVAYGKAGKGEGVSIGITGAVSIELGTSIDPVVINRLGITKSLNGSATEAGKMSSDRIGERSMIDFGLYRFNGSIQILDAQRNGVSVDDVAKLKHYLTTLFVNDASSARPAGSMEVVKVYWWEHNCENGQYGQGKVFRSVNVSKRDGIYTPASIDDYDFTVDNSYQTRGELACEVTEGF